MYTHLNTSISTKMNFCLHTLRVVFNEPELAVDADLSTFYHSGMSYEPYIAVDLGRSYDIWGLAVHPRAPQYEAMKDRFREIRVSIYTFIFYHFICVASSLRKKIKTGLKLFGTDLKVFFC